MTFVTFEAIKRLKLIDESGSLELISILKLEVQRLFIQFLKKIFLLSFSVLQDEETLNPATKTGN